VFCKCFRRMLQVFHLFQTYVASVSSGCCKSRSGVAHVAMRVRYGGGASGPRMRSGGACDVRKAWAMRGRAKIQARTWSVGASTGNGVQLRRSGRLSTSTTEKNKFKQFF
jgi:hypothetical protein